MTVDTFEKQLDVLGRIGEFVDAQQIRSAIRGEKSLPAKSFLITFDDGLREQFDHAWAVVKRKGIPGIFLVNTRPLSDRVVLTVHKVHLLRATLGGARLSRMLDAVSKRKGIELDWSTDAATAMVKYLFDVPEDAQLKYFLNFTLPLNTRKELIDAVFQETFEQHDVSEQLYMDVEQIKCLAAAAAIGTHCHDHMPLRGLSPETASEMIGLSNVSSGMDRGDSPVDQLPLWVAKCNLRGRGNCRRFVRARIRVHRRAGRQRGTQRPVLSCSLRLQRSSRRVGSDLVRAQPV